MVRVYDEFKKNNIDEMFHNLTENPVGCEKKDFRLMISTIYQLVEDEYEDLEEIYEEEEKSTVETEISTEETETEQIIQETQKTEEQYIMSLLGFI